MPQGMADERNKDQRSAVPRERRVDDSRRRKGPIKTRVGRGVVKALVKLGDPLTRQMAGKRGMNLALLVHTGRKSGRVYETVTGAARVEDGFVVPWVFESHSQWYRNVWANGRARLKWRGRNYELDRPEVVGAGRALGAFPVMMRMIYKGMGVDEFVLLHKVKVTASSNR